MKLEKPECGYGYTSEQIKRIIGDKEDEFNKWMSGQTVMLCNEHGVIVYEYDLNKFLSKNLEIWD